MLVGLEPVHVPAAKLMSHQFLTLKNPDDVPHSGQCWSIVFTAQVLILCTNAVPDFVLLMSVI